MKKIALYTFILFSLFLNMMAANEPDFKRHTFQLSVAAGLDHQLVVRKYKNPVTAQSLNNQENPFAGFCFGLHYVYRPIRMFGISTGFESLEYGNRMGNIVFYSPASQVDVISVYKGFGFDGSIGVPFYIHFYRQISKFTVELATGPEFFFEVYSTSKYQVTGNDPFAVETYNIHSTQYFSGVQIKQSASLAWSMQLLANIPMTHAFDMAIGPEWKFLELVSISPGNHTDFSVPRSVPFFLGVKACFSLGSNFWKKTDRYLGKE